MTVVKGASSGYSLRFNSCQTSQASSGVQLSYLEFSPSCLVPSWLAFPISPTQVEIQFSLCAPFHPLYRSWCEWVRWAGASVIRAGHRAPSQVFTHGRDSTVCSLVVFLRPEPVVLFRWTRQSRGACFSPLGIRLPMKQASQETLRYFGFGIYPGEFFVSHTDGLRLLWHFSTVHPPLFIRLQRFIVYPNLGVVELHSGHRIPYSSSSMTFYYSRTTSSVYIF